MPLFPRSKRLLNGKSVGTIECCRVQGSAIPTTKQQTIAHALRYIIPFVKGIIIPSASVLPIVPGS